MLWELPEGALLNGSFMSAVLADCFQFTARQMPLSECRYCFCFYRGLILWWFVREFVFV